MFNELWHPETYRRPFSLFGLVHVRTLSFTTEESVGGMRNTHQVVRGLIENMGLDGNEKEAMERYAKEHKIQEKNIVREINGSSINIKLPNDEAKQLIDYLSSRGYTKEKPMDVLVRRLGLHS